MSKNTVSFEGRRIDLDIESFLSQHDVIYLSPASEHRHVKTCRPGENFIDGPLLGNGDIGLVVHGRPQELLINVGKNDVWDRRFGLNEFWGTPSPLFYNRAAEWFAKRYGTVPSTGWITQDELLSMVLNDEDGSGTKECYEIAKILHAPYASEETPPLPKPVGQIIIRSLDLENASFYQRLSLYNALLESIFKTDESNDQLCTFVSAEENVILTKYSHQGEKALELTLDLCRWNDKVDKTMTLPTVGFDDKYFWVRYCFPPDPMYPDGFEYVMLAAIQGARYVTEGMPNVARARIHGERACEVEIFMSVVTSRDADQPFEEAKRLVNKAMSSGYEKILEKHKGWWHTFWEKSFIDLSDDFMENLWYLNQYFLACCSRKGKVAPGLYGNWITNDSSSWHGDYHLDYNFEQQYWGVYSSNHIELAYPYYDVISHILPWAKKVAREIYGCRGAKYPIKAYPTKMPSEPYPPFPYDRIMAISAWVAQNFWWHYKYTLDEEFLRKQAYPVISECARFYQDYMKKENGKYVIWPTMSPEHHGITPKFRLNRNCTIDLALIKFLLKAVIEASEKLGVDEDDRRIWREMLDNIAPYPTYDTAGGKILVDVENASPILYNYPVSLAPVFPGEDIGPDSPEELYRIAKRTAETILINGNDGYITLGIVWMRLGLKYMYPLFRIMTLQRVRFNGCLAMMGFPPFQYWNNGPVVENFAYTAVINEMLLQSYNGKIRVFPSLPENLDARIAGLRAVGTFLVSSEIEKAEVKYIKIESLKGSTCTVINPWEEEDARVRDMTEHSLLKSKSRNKLEITFDTSGGHIYVIDREDKPYESLPPLIIKGVRRTEPRKEGPACIGKP